MTSNSSDILRELEAILKGNSWNPMVSLGKVTPLASETEAVAIYISAESIALEVRGTVLGVEGYNRHFFITLYCNIKTDSDYLKVYDFTDSVERSILDDNAIWGKLVDRDIVAINYDNQEHLPMRSVTILLDINFRLACA